VNTIVDEISGLDWDIVPKDEVMYEQVREEIKNIKSWLEYPNKNGESFMEITRSWLKDMLEVDAGVLTKVFDVGSYDFEHLEPKSGAPLLKPRGQRTMVELYARDGSSFLKEVDKFGFLAGYWQYSYQIPAHPMWFNRDEVSYLCEHPRSMSCYGYARTQAILDIVKTLHYSNLYNKKYFEELPIPDGLIGLEETNEAEMKAFMDWWNFEFKAQPHKVAAVNKKLTWTPFNITNKELQFLESQMQYYKFVISMFGLTPAELGVTDDLNRATSATQAELSKRKGIRPILKLLEKRVNEDVISEFLVDGIEFQFIYDDPAEKKAKLDNWKLELDMGVKTINEVRNELGLEPVEWGDQANTGFSQMPGEQDSFSSPEEEGQSGNYHDTRRREENDKETSRQVADKYRDDPGKKAIGSIKGLSFNPGMNEIEQMAQRYMYVGDLEQLKMGIEVESEHMTTVGYDMDVIMHIALDHLKEDPLYYSKLKRMEEKNYHVPKLSPPEVPSVGIGQFYNEPNQVLQVAKPPKVPIQGMQARNENFQDADAVKRNSSTCPQCGKNTLVLLANPDDAKYGDPLYKCNNCGWTGGRSEVLNDEVLSNFEETLMTNPYEQPEHADWSPKNYSKDRKKDMDMTFKEFVGFEFEKSLTFASGYVESAEYKKMLGKYLADYDEHIIHNIIEVLRDAVAMQKTPNQISNEINQLIRDPKRSDMIARTEIIRITNEGNRREMKVRGVTKVEFISAPEDGRLCSQCKEMDGKHFSINKKNSFPPIHPRCRCTTAEIYE
jgi:SPP1 gp7 family putative phage head morphogenesis protein